MQFVLAAVFVTNTLSPRSTNAKQLRWDIFLLFPLLVFDDTAGGSFKLDDSCKPDKLLILFFSFTCARKKKD